MAQELIYLIQCQDCQQKTRIDLRELARRLNADPLEWLTGRLQCRECGSRQFTITPYWLASSPAERARQWPLKGN
jgi:hypothetical protein